MIYMFCNGLGMLKCCIYNKLNVKVIVLTFDLL